MANLEDLEALVERVGQGDSEAFSALYMLTSGKLFGVCLRVLASRPKAQAALWAAFIQIQKEAGSFGVTGLGPMTWMIHVAHQKATQRLRHDAAGTDYSANPGDVVQEGEWPEDLLLKPSDHSKLINCMEVLPWERSAVFRLAFVEGETYSDMAAHFDLPVDVMRTWVRQDLQILVEGLSR